MQENMTIARSYATAIFSIACSNKSFKDWKIMLNQLNSVIQKKELKIFFCGFYSYDIVLNIFLIYCNNDINIYGQNLIKLLTIYKRLKIIPNILNFFVQLYNNYFNIINIEIIFSHMVNQEIIKKIKLILSKKFLKKIKLTYKIQPSIISGLVIRSNDVIIDDCIFSHLSELFNYLSP